MDFSLQMPLICFLYVLVKMKGSIFYVYAPQVFGNLPLMNALLWKEFMWIYRLMLKHNTVAYWYSYLCYKLAFI